MAKHSSPRSSGISKFRMVVIDAELQEGEISQLAQAIQGAFSGQRGTPLKLNGAAARSLPSADASVEMPVELDGADVVEAPVVPAPPPPRPKALRKFRTPNLDRDLRPENEPSFKAYAEARNVTGTSNVRTKFLIVAAWLHEERSGTKITADRAYTCFRFIQWPFNINFGHPLRDLKAKNSFLELKAEDKGKGEFSITHLGLDKATKMKTTS